MSIQLVDSNMQKGLAIIVGDKVDGIILHAAELLSNTKPEFLKDVKRGLILGAKKIYLLGHGDYFKYTIDGKSVEDIVNELMKKGYQGQSLEILSCDAGLMYKSKSFYTEFLKVLHAKGISTSNVLCRAYGKTIVLDNKISNHICLWIVYDKRASYASYIQSSFLKKNKLVKISDFPLGQENTNKVYNFKESLVEYFKCDIKVSDRVNIYDRLFVLFGIVLATLLSLVDTNILSLTVGIRELIFGISLCFLLCLIILRKDEVFVDIIVEFVVFLDTLIMAYMGLSLLFLILTPLYFYIVSGVLIVLPIIYIVCVGRETQLQ